MAYHRLADSDGTIEISVPTDGLLGKVSDLFRRASGIVQAAGPAVNAAVQILEDPYLPETACEIVRLSHIEAGDAVGPPCKRTDPAAAQSGRGVGLRHAVVPLRAYVRVRQDPWIGVMVAGSVIGGIFYLGYRFGRRR